MNGQQKSYTEKKKVGRPAGQRFIETIPVRLTPELRDAIARWGNRNKISHSEAIRRLLEKALRE